ncbi:MAG: SEL1-like repeat protein, partial [Deltaproteobacteria bacterium]|nr:SEL1-like repeat protein [Deltaproteobacteria bacterium]
HAKAQNNLGFMYDHGEGVPQNYKKAYILYDLSSAQGNKKAKYNISIIEPRMAPAQIVEAQKEAAELRKKIKK